MFGSRVLQPTQGALSLTSLRELLVFAAILGACSSPSPRVTNREPPEDSTSAVTARPAGDPPPLILACQNRIFGGEQAVQIVEAGDHLLVISERRSSALVARIDLRGVVTSVRRVDPDPPLSLPMDGWVPPLPTPDGRWRITSGTPDAYANGYILSSEGELRFEGRLTAPGPAYAPDGVRTATELALTRVTSEGRGETLRFRAYLDFYEIGSDTRGAVLDAGCSRIESVVSTTWGYAVVCRKDTPGAYDGHHERDDHDWSLLGVVDRAVAWRTPLPDAWGASLGTDGTDLLVIANVSSIEPHLDDGKAHEVHAVRVARDGRILGEQRGQGRVGFVEEPRLVFAGSEFAALGERSITRFDLSGRPLGTWRFEPDCAREHQDARLIWTGDAYALCSWHRTVFDHDDAYDEQFCNEVEDTLPLYPNLVYDAAEAERRAELDD